jgi:energy-coupling factor transport system substrate-specific component
MAWDVPRAIFTSILLITAGAPVLHTLRRAHTRARFLTPIEIREFNERATRPSESKQLQQN